MVAYNVIMKAKHALMGATSHMFVKLVAFTGFAATQTTLSVFVFELRVYMQFDIVYRYRTAL